jgi:hypothetical protein
MIESSVNTVKLLLRKMLATHTDLNWEFLPFLVSKILNNSINPNTGFSPFTMVYGADHSIPSFLQSEPSAMPHFSVRPNKARIKALTKEIQRITTTAQDKLTQIRMKATERVNKSRKETNFNQETTYLSLIVQLSQEIQGFLEQSFRPPLIFA